jgi:hypothetical protein
MGARRGTLITPVMVTPGGRYRWNLEDLRAELRML